MYEGGRTWLRTCERGVERGGERGANEGVSGGRARSKDEGAHEGCNLAGAKEGEKVFDFAHDWPYALLNSETCGWLGGKALLFSQYIILGGKTLGQEKVPSCRFTDLPQKEH